MYIKLNKKGFTLVELLITIAIVGLVIGFSVYGIISLINNSEDETEILNENNVKDAAKLYSAEASSNSWKKTEYDYDAFCVTIGELMNKGLLDKKSSLNNNLSREDYIIVKRNKNTFAIESEELVSDVIGDINNSICTGQINEDEVITVPRIVDYVSYTDRLVINFDEGTAESGIKNYKCLYGNSSSNINREGQVNGTTCELNNLTKNSNYYVFIYMNTNKGSSILASGDNSYNTNDFEDMTVSQEKNTITIDYDDSNVLNPSHYFKSSVAGNANLNVQMCTYKNNTFTCGENTQTIEEYKWYKLIGDNIIITYPEENNTINITSRIQDESNNFKENTDIFEIKKYTVKFYKNTASSIDGSTNEYIEKYCIAKGNKTCNITAPSITAKTGYSSVGWSNISTSTTSSWNISISKDINSNLNYYAITRINKVYISYNVNGGIIATPENSYAKWFTDDNGLVHIIKTSETQSRIKVSPINYGSVIGTNGLNDYNNKSYLNISNDGHHAISEAEWICLSNECLGKTYDQYNNDYTAADFCDASNSDCTVVLGVNWKANNYTLTYQNQSGSGCNSKTGTYGSTWGTLCTPSRKGYTFGGWYTSTGGSGTKITSSSIVSGNLTVYAKWTANTYTVTYDGNGGLYNGSETWVDPTKATYGQAYTTYSNNNFFVRDGYTFAGWKDDMGRDWTSYMNNPWIWSDTSDVTLYAQWNVTTTINTNKYVCEGNNRLAIYYITTCTGNTCKYTTKNGLNSSYNFGLDISGSPSWAINSSSYVSSLTDPITTSGNSCDLQTWYVDASSLNCRSGASTSNTVVTNTWSKCTDINVYRTTMKINDSHNWFYSKKYGCYLYGEYLSSSKPSGCSSSTTTCKYTCVRSYYNGCDNAGYDVGTDGRCYSYNQTSCPSGWSVYSSNCS